MTCKKHQRCNLCDTRHAFRGVGNLAYEIKYPGKESHTPVVELCEGCLARALGATQEK